MACMGVFEPPTFGSGAWESYLPLSQTMLSKDTTRYAHGYPVILHGHDRLHENRDMRTLTCFVKRGDPLRRSHGLNEVAGIQCEGGRELTRHGILSILREQELSPRLS